MIQQSGEKSKEDVYLMQKELNDENELIALLKTELLNHKTYVKYMFALISLIVIY